MSSIRSCISTTDSEGFEEIAQNAERELLEIVGVASHITDGIDLWEDEELVEIPAKYIRKLRDLLIEQF